MLAVIRRKAGALRIDAPPTFEPPEPFVTNAEARHATRTARLAGLEVEESLEHRAGSGPIRLTLAAVDEDHARRAGAQLVTVARSSALATSGRPPLRALVWLALSASGRGLGRPRLRSRASRAEPPAAGTLLHAVEFS